MTKSLLWNVASTRNMSMLWVCLGSAATAAAVAASVVLVTRKKRPKKEELTAEEEFKLIRQVFSPKSVPNKLDYIVIGSGMGGLTTASILAQEGKRVLVLEQHKRAGGNTHTFSKKGFEFDTGVHYVGMGDRRVRNQMKYVTRGGKSLSWTKMDTAFDVAVVGTERIPIREGLDNVIADLQRQFPNPKDQQAIDLHFRYVARVEQLVPILFALRMIKAGTTTFSLTSPLMDLFLSVLSKCFPTYTRLFTQSTQEVLDSITDNVKLKGILAYHYGDCGEVPSREAFFVHAMLWTHFTSGGYYPVGGSSKIAKTIVPIIQEAGGAVLNKATVTQLLVNKNSTRVIGVQVNGQDNIYAPTVISSIGAYNTYHKLIPSTCHALIQRELQGLQDPTISSQTSLMSLFVGLNLTPGLDDDKIQSLPKQNIWIFPSWDHSANWKEFQNGKPTSKIPAAFICSPSAKDPDYHKRIDDTKHAICVIGPCLFEDVEEWQFQKCKRRGPAYMAYKDGRIQQFKQLLLQEFPQLEGHIQYIDLGTAVTNNHYLGTHRGAVYGLAHTPQRFQKEWLQPQTPLRGLYLSGQDVCSCGIAGAMMGGILCTTAMNPLRWISMGMLLA